MQGRYPRAFRLDDSGAFPRGLELGLLSMAKGEMATLMVRCDYAYGPEGKMLHTGIYVPPNATLKYDVRHKFSKSNVPGGADVSLHQTFFCGWIVASYSGTVVDAPFFLRPAYHVIRRSMHGS